MILAASRLVSASNLAECRTSFDNSLNYSRSFVCDNIINMTDD